MFLSRFSFVLTVMLTVGWAISPVLAQPPAGTRTLEDLAAQEPKNPPATPEQEATKASPARPVGTLARPENGVQHPDLDKAWADYDVAVTKAAEAILVAINKQFDAATAKGDLDAAEKWQNALEKFEEAGELPKDKETKTPASEAAAGLRKAGEELVAAYEAVVKNVTMEKKLAEAKVVRDEMKLVLAKVRLRQDSPPREEGAEINSTQLVGGPGGGGFEDQPPQGAKVVGVVIRSGELLDAIQVVYRLPNGRLQPGNHHGGNGGGATTFELMGKFMMGEGSRAVGVILSKPFLLGKYEVTQGQFKKVMGTEPWVGPSGVQIGNDNAASYVTWGDATAFCQRLTDTDHKNGKLLAGESYRLPTDAEWEYACRASTQTTWSFGNDESQLGNYGWYEGNAKNVGQGYAHKVGLKKPNPAGLFDMHGNVWEWCSDWIGSGLSGGTDPAGPGGGSYRVLRGASWWHAPDRCRSANRDSSVPSNRIHDRGFRVARSQSAQ